MIPTSLGHLAQVTGGRLADGAGGDPSSIQVTDLVTTDSRDCRPGSLFVARVGEHEDGHGYVAAAAAAGAVAALTTHPVPGLPCLVVPDTERAFGQVARDVLDRREGLLVTGITGSSGKTTTKDLLAAVLASEGPTVAPVGSLNGEIGVPLTVCRVTPDTRYLVVEMGARGVGHIAYLTGIAPPTIGVVLGVGAAHLGIFGSRETIALAKGELVEALPPHGLAVLNADDPLVAAMAERTRAQVVLVGRGPQADHRADEVTLDELGRPSFRLATPHGQARVSLRLSGAHQVGNALAVAAVALHAGLSLDQVATALGRAEPVSRWRMEIHDRPDGVRIVNDAYNANPDSVRAAIQALVAMGSARPQHPRRTWLVLGEMLELGTFSTEEHEGVGRYAGQQGVDVVVAVGPGAEPAGRAAQQAGARSYTVPDVDAAYRLLQRDCRPGDVVLLKSSRDAGLRFLGERLCAQEVSG